MSATMTHENLGSCHHVLLTSAYCADYVQPHAYSQDRCPEKKKNQYSIRQKRDGKKYGLGGA